MNKNIFKSSIFLCVTILFGMVFFISPAKAIDKLSMEVTQMCSLQYAGDSCIVKLNLTNNTDAILQGEAMLTVEQQNGSFDGIGIEQYFKINQEAEWIKATWNGESLSATNFNIEKGENNAELKIVTHSALYPDHYAFLLTIKGTENEEEYVSKPTTLVGGGGYINPEIFQSVQQEETPSTEIPETDTPISSEDYSEKPQEKNKEILAEIEEIVSTETSPKQASAEDTIVFTQDVQENNTNLISKETTEETKATEKDTSALFTPFNLPDKIDSKSAALISEAIENIWTTITDSTALSIAFILLATILLWLGIKKWKKKRRK